MSGKYFNFTDVLGYGWRAMKANLGFFIGLGFLYMIISMLPSLVRMAVPYLPLPKAGNVTLMILLQLIEWVIKIVLGIGMQNSVSFL